MKRLAAVASIFLCSAIAWMILAGSIWTRTSNSSERLRSGVASSWGTAQEQPQPYAALQPAEGAPTVSAAYLTAERSRVHADLDLGYRQKGLLWYSTYVVRFTGLYTFRNTADGPRRVEINFNFPAKQAVYDNLTISANGRTLPFSANDNGASAWVTSNAGQTVEYRVTYKSNGLDAWSYKLGTQVTQTHDFELTVGTNFKDIDFPANTLSPTMKRETKRGWELAWSYLSLVSGIEIGVAMPEKLQPGPVAGEISTFAPVSLFLFFFVVSMLSIIRKVELHPMNYFFLAAAFFAFHLLLAYSVDHISIGWAFAVSSLVSVGLVITYLRIVAGPEFAIREAGIAQFVYLILFSSSFFLKGFTGLAITIGCIITLFIAMQATARISWREQFAQLPPRR